jgi:hypothetical protein
MSKNPLGSKFTAPTVIPISGIRDAVKLIRVDGPKARRLADLALHRNDLKFARACLEALKQLPDEEDFISHVLWRSAIVHYFKCFGDSSQRFQLDPKRVYKGRPAEALAAFEFFKPLRNKHLVHDENAYMQCTIGAAINDGTKAYKVERIVAPVSTFDVRNPQNLTNLRLLIKDANEWVTKQFDELAALIGAELEQIPYTELAASLTIQVQVPTLQDVAKPRDP